MRENYRYFHVPVPGGGYVTGFQFHPAVPGILYARTDIGGTYRHDPARNVWESLIEWVGGDDLAATFPAAIALDAQNPDRLYIACGDGRAWWSAPPEERFADACGKLLVSGDRGQTFSTEEIPCYIHGNLPGRSTGSRLVVSPADGSTLFFASQRDGLLVTHDRGKTWLRRDVCGERYLTFVWLSPDGTTVVVGAAGVSTGTKEMRGHGLYLSRDGGASFVPLAQPENHIVRDSLLSGYVPQRADFDGMYLYVTLANTGAHNFVTEMGYGCDTGALLGGRVIRYRLEADGGFSAWEDITPEGGADDLPYGFGGISSCRTAPGLLAVSTLCRMDGDILYVSRDRGGHWERALCGLETGGLHFETPYMKPAYNGGRSLLHWMSDVKIDPFDPDTLWFNSGTGVFVSRNFTRDDRSFVDACRGIEETVHLNLYSPPSGRVRLIDILGDLGGFAFSDLHAPCENSFADDAGNRYITCLNADYADRAPERFVVTARGNWTGETKGGAILTADGGRHFARLPLPYGLTARMDTLCGGMERPNVNVGWAAMGADGATIVLGLADTTTLPADCAAVTHDEGARWERVRVCDLAGSEVDGAHRLKIFADRTDAEVFYGFGEAGRFYVSRDRGHTFFERTVTVSASVSSESVLPEGAGAWPAAEFGFVDCENRTEIRGDSGFAGVFYMALGDAGLWRLRYRKETDEVRAERLAGGADAVYRVGLGRLDGEDAYIGRHKAIYICGVVGGTYGFFRSDDDGASWKRLNDERHQFGEINSIEGDSREPGRFFIGTGSLGVLCGERG